MAVRDLGKEHYALYQLTDFHSGSDFLVQVSLDSDPNVERKIKPGLTFITREATAKPTAIERCTHGLDMLYEYLEYKCSGDLTGLILMTSEEAQELTAKWKDNRNLIRDSISGFYGAPNYTDLQIDVLSEKVDAQGRKTMKTLRSIETYLSALADTVLKDDK